MQNNKLNKDQEQALKLALNGDDLMITGGAGVGKSYLLQEIIRKLKSAGKRVAVSASTGMAASIIKGVTLHSMLRLGINCYTRTNMLKKGSTAVLQACDVLIIDEISMVRGDVWTICWQAVERVRQDHALQVIVCGDFCQLPPVVTDQDRTILQQHNLPVNGFCFATPAWQRAKFKVVTLTEVMRQRDAGWIDILNRLRVGDMSVVPDISKYTSKVPLPAQPHVYSRNVDVDAHNKVALAKIAAPPIKIDAHKQDGTPYPDADVTIKIGARVMITRNDMYHRYHNGTIGTVVGIATSDDPTVAVKLDDDTVVNVPMTEHAVYHYEVGCGVLQIVKDPKASYIAMPLRLAYAITVHKSQGQTWAGMTLNADCFAPGMLYVALSRVSDPSKIYLERPIDPSDVLVDPDVMAFYAGGSTKRRRGRPATGQGRSVRVPMALVAHIQREIRNGCPQPINYAPPLVGTKVIYVPAYLLEHVLTDIKNWKES